MDRNEALDIVRKNWPKDIQYTEALRTLIPELRESEDERIRKTLIHIVKGACSNYGIKYQGKEIGEEKLLAWLEKQGEQNPITFNDAHIIDSALNDYCCKQYGALYKENGGVLSFARLQHLAMDIYGWCEKQNLANSEKTCKVEPKFKVGDKIINPINQIWVVDDIDNEYCHVTRVKDGFRCYFKLQDQNQWKLAEQKSKEWSEEEQENLDAAIDMAEHSLYEPLVQRDVLVNWLKSLKEREMPQPKPSWSKDDKEALRVVTNIFEQHGVKLLCYPAFVHWLKTLPNRITFNPYWKPSDEQIEALEHFVRCVGESGYMSPYDRSTKIVYSLLDDLKKLKR